MKVREYSELQIIETVHMCFERRKGLLKFKLVNKLQTFMVTNSLHIDAMISFTIYKGVFINRWSLDTDMGPVNTPNYIGKSSSKVKSRLNGRFLGWGRGPFNKCVGPSSQSICDSLDCSWYGAFIKPCCWQKNSC